MDSFDDPCWEFLDYNLMTGTSSTDLCWINNSVEGGGFGSSHVNVVSGQGKECRERESDSTRKRGRSDSCSSVGSKACRERLRREKLNDRFLDLSLTLDPERPAKTDKILILNDAIQTVKQLRSDVEEVKEENQKLLDDIKNLKAEKNELREEKIKMKADKEKMEQQLKAMAMPPGFLPAAPATYPAAVNKVPVYSSYGLIPMWQYLPPSTVDTSHDHELRPPAA